MTARLRPLPILAALVALLAFVRVDAQTAPEPLLVTAPVRVSLPSPYPPNCASLPADEPGTNVRNGVAEPRLSVNPRDSRHIVTVWQQDRWSNGGASGLQAAVSRDGGRTWTQAAAPFSRCTGGMPENGGDYERASDPWVTFAPNGDVYQIALATSGRAGGRTSAILVSRSQDGGLTWSAPTRLIEDREPIAFNDKESITADPYDPRYVYAVWDRVDPRSRAPSGPIWFARTVDGGETWEAARTVFAPDGQTIANQIVVLPGGDLLNVFSLFRAVPRTGGAPATRQTVATVRSSDKGVTWSEPIEIADVVRATVTDPATGTEVRAGAPILEPAVDPRDGTVYVVWQDGRFSGGSHPDIALALSRDGGLTWSEPVKVNQTPVAAPAFTPNVAVLADGAVGVTYYDLRSDTPDPATLPASYWLAACRAACHEAAAWSENLIAEAFDVDEAPRTTQGYFLGDYQGLVANGLTFLMAFVQSDGGPDRPSDVWFATASATRPPTLAGTRRSWEPSSRISLIPGTVSIQTN